MTLYQTIPTKKVHAVAHELGLLLGRWGKTETETMFTPCKVEDTPDILRTIEDYGFDLSKDEKMFSFYFLLKQIELKGY